MTWLRTERVLLPGVSVLARLVMQVRAEATNRLYEALAGQVDGGLRSRMEDLLGCRRVSVSPGWIGCGVPRLGRRAGR